MDKPKTIDIDLHQYSTIARITQQFLAPNGGLPVVLLPLGEDRQPMPNRTGYGCTTQDEFVAALRAIYKLSPCQTARLIPVERSA